MISISKNLSSIRNNIEIAAKKSGRSASDITLIAVTKYVPADIVREVVSCGVFDIGENKVFDAKQKKEQIADSVVWHMIGHLQTNKVKEAVAIFDTIDAVDSLKLLKEIDRRAGSINKVMDVLLEVNVSGEESKFGLNPDEVAPLINAAESLSNIKINGLMTMAPFVDDENVLRNTFSGLRKLRDNLDTREMKNIDLRHLSMGMSADYQIAIEEGATMVRIGSAIF